MNKLWIISGVFLCILISGTHAHPSPFQRNTEDEDEEVDSDEVEETDNLRNVVNNLGNGGAGNLTDAELAEKASKFLAQYLAQNGGIGAGGLPLLQVPNQNSTIFIALVDGKNGSEVVQQNPTQPPFLSPDAYPFLFPTVASNQPELVGDFVFREQRSTYSPLQVAPAPTLPPFYLSPSYLYPTLSPPVYSTKPPLPPASEVGVDNIEDAILEALLVAQEASTSSPSINNNNQGQFQQIQLPASALNPIYNLSALGLFQNNQSFNPADLGLQAFLLNPYTPPAQSAGVPPGANPQLHAIAGLFGSLAQGNLAGVVQSSLKLAGTGILQNVAHSVNCQLFRHCDSRVPVYKI